MPAEKKDEMSFDRCFFGASPFGLARTEPGRFELATGTPTGLHDMLLGMSDFNGFSPPRIIDAADLSAWTQMWTVPVLRYATIQVY